MDNALSRMRNIGISAHIDSGKTTLTERILYYCKKIHRMHEVKGKEGGGATMDFMELERERGITISSATTNVSWQDHSINIIDTPGHVDFTIEVERSLRVLDGAILVLCSVGGVQSQTLTVDKQLKRYKVPILAFINKLDRVGANPFKVKDQIVNKLGRRAALLQIPIGLEDNLRGVVDLVSLQAIYFDGPSGENIRQEEIPAELRDEAIRYREELLDTVSLSSDELAEAVLEDKVSPELLRRAIRQATIRREFTPVFIGSAYRNKGIQPLLDGVINYLPHPGEVENIALDLDHHEQPVVLQADSELPCVAYAFKLEEGPYGQLTYVRIYQGKIKKGDELFNARSRQKFKVGRLVRMHADHMEDITEALAGDIIALFGVDFASGDTICSPGLNYTLTSIYVPEPVISLAIEPVDKISSDRLSRALSRFTKEDPTFRTYLDPESRQMIIQGMGELHLDVYIERMKREYKVEVVAGQPQVAYREAITARADFDYIHKKQTGGAGQFARVTGYLEPFEGSYEFVNEIKGGHIPREFIPSCDKGFQASLKKGQLLGSPIIGVRVVLTDGQFHPVDSSDLAFQLAAQGAFKQAYKKAKPQLLEPIMKVVVETPSEYSGHVFASLNQRRGIIISSIETGVYSTIEAEVPLSEMFGYSSVLRSMTQGKAEFTMEFLKYARVPQTLADELMEKHRQEIEKEKGK
ncbi:MAG TPA: elongation factor G [Candidatus Saccharicenans sp.]|nr:elongation factor G [Candidatus Saccharicenans sp.]